MAISSSTSSGDGKYSTIASKRLSTPILRLDEPQNTGKTLPSLIPAFSAICISSLVNSSPAKYFSMSSSLVSAAASLIISTMGSTSSFIDSGIGLSTEFCPSNVHIFFSRTLIKPSKWSPSFTGTKKGATCLPNVALSCSKTL